MAAAPALGEARKLGWREGETDALGRGLSEMGEARAQLGLSLLGSGVGAAADMC